MSTRRKLRRQLKKQGFKLGEGKSDEWLEKYERWYSNIDRIAEHSNKGEMDKAIALRDENVELWNYLKEN